ncbi:hypothetical protein OS493_010304 [Desmophyllum pertusum]|uniref:Uncharacterized protein n=1 Tax=Desmophyllum pertusum TaxID=174260 RepID=A0A9X0DBI3_9CNID|nr:hypothetical protein OS493_010304 [Desmophyllum pertusum]
MANVRDKQCDKCRYTGNGASQRTSSTNAAETVKDSQIRENMNKLQVQLQHCEQQIQELHGKMLLQFEKELAQAVEALTREQERAEQAEREKQAQLKQQKEERSKLLECLSKEKDTVSQMEQENLQVIQEKEENRTEQLRIFEELQSQISSLEAEHNESLAREQEKLQEEMQTSKDGQAVLASVQKEVQRLEMELDTSNREKVFDIPLS